MHATEERSAEYKTPKERQAHRRKGVFVGLGVAAVSLIALAGIVTAVKPRADVTVVDASTNAAISGATVVLNDERFITDSDGVARIRTFTMGALDVTISRDAYTPATARLELRYGRKQASEVKLELAKTAQTINFTVTDAVNGEALPTASVQLADQSEVKADAAGKVTLVFTDHSLVTVRAQGYRDQQIPTDAITDSLVLVPAGDVIFVSNRDRGLRGLYRSTFDGAAVQPLVAREGQGEDYLPLRSPDGGLVAFVSTRGGNVDAYGNTQGQVYVVRADGTGLKRLSDGVNPEGIKWSPTGRYLYWVEVPHGQRDMLKRYTVSSGQVSTLFTYPAIYSNFTLSNDGTRIAFVAATEPNQSATLWVSEIDGSNAKSTSYNASTFQFNRDGNVEFSSYVDDGRKSFVLFADSGVVQETQQVIDEDRTYVLSPDGTSQVYVATRDGKSDLYRIDRQGRETQLTKLGTVSSIERPYWVVNGRYVVFAVQSPTESALYIIGLTGADAKKITDATFDGYGYF